MRRAGLVLAVVTALLVAGGLVLLRPNRVLSSTSFSVPQASEVQLDSFAQQRVFFAHQSVGENLLDAMPGLVEAQDAASSTIVSLGDQPESGTALIETAIGTNGDPLGKIAEFDQILRDGLGDDIDVAVLKLCYIDFSVATDVEELFTAYTTTIAALEADFPDVTFIYTTAPLVSERDVIERLKNLLGRAMHRDPSENTVRHRYNELIRDEYGSSGRLLDIAAIQASDASGMLQTREADGQPYQAMDPQWASDPGHLNPDGAARLANAFVALIADSQA